MKEDKKVIFSYYWGLLGSGDSILQEYRFGAMACGGPGEGLRERLREASLQDWRFDWAFPRWKVAVEVEGGVFVRGGHNRGAYYTDNCRKYNAAASMGWLVFRFTPDMLQDDPKKCISQVLCGLGIKKNTTKRLEVEHAPAE